MYIKLLFPFVANTIMLKDVNNNDDDRGSQQGDLGVLDPFLSEEPR